MTSLQTYKCCPIVPNTIGDCFQIDSTFLIGLSLMNCIDRFVVYPDSLHTACVDMALSNLNSVWAIVASSGRSIKRVLFQTGEWAGNKLSWENFTLWGKIYCHLKRCYTVNADMHSSRTVPVLCREAQAFHSFVGNEDPMQLWMVLIISWSLMYSMTIHQQPQISRNSLH